MFFDKIKFCKSHLFLHLNHNHTKSKIYEQENFEHNSLYYDDAGSFHAVKRTE